jgi:hypothetical protein
MGRTGAPSTTSMALLDHIRIQAAGGEVCLADAGGNGGVKCNLLVRTEGNGDDGDAPRLPDVEVRLDPDLSAIVKAMSARRVATAVS